MTVILEVEHVTTYRDAQAVRFAEDRVALHPRTAHDIQNEGLPVDPDAKFYPFDCSPDDRYELSNFLPLKTALTRCRGRSTEKNGLALANGSQVACMASKSVAK